jgi:hypothetical protein
VAEQKERQHHVGSLSAAYSSGPVTPLMRDHRPPTKSPKSAQKRAVRVTTS